MSTNVKSLRIEYGYTPNVLLLGNGINRAYDFASWDELIKSIQTKELSKEEENALETMPYPLRPIILTDDHVDEKLKNISCDLSELRAGKEEESVLRSLASLPFDAILTTNYTYELEKAIHSEFKCVSKKKCKNRHVTCDKQGKNATRQLHTYFEGSNENQTIWHIHGEANRPDTMVLGHYFYGKLLSLMQSYVALFQKRYKGNVVREQGMNCYSWIDLFMLGNVYVVGQGLDMSELDLWWLINCKRRHFPETSITLYKTNIPESQRMLCEAYNIRMIRGELKDKDYKSYYNKTIEDIRNLL